MDDTTLPSMPSEPDLPTKAVPTSIPTGTSLIQNHVAHSRSHTPIILWLLVLVSLFGTAGVGYMAYTQQNALNGYSTALTGYQTNVEQWSEQVNMLQTTVQAMQGQINLLTAAPVPTLFVTQSSLSTSTLLPLASTLPTTTNNMGDDSFNKLDDIRVTATPQSEPSMFDEDSLSEGRMSNEDEVNMINAYLREIVAGQHKTTQPDGLSTFRSRETSADGQVIYDIFKSSTDEDMFYIYVRKGPATAPNGWFGPFSSFPGS